MALLDFMEKLGTAKNKSLVTLGVFIDLRKLFDTIDNLLLIKKIVSLWYKLGWIVTG